MTDPIRTTFAPLDIDLHCAVVPYVRMTQKSKFVDPSAIRYMDSQKELKFLMSIANHNREYYQDWYVPEKCPFGATMTFHTKTMHRCDLDNLAKSIFDAGSKILYCDDRWCDEFHAKRVYFEGEPWVNLRIYPLTEVEE